MKNHILSVVFAKPERVVYLLGMRPLRSLLEIHAAILLFGLAGLFGKWLSLSPLIIVLGRVFFASLVLGGILVFSGRSCRFDQNRSFILLPFLGFLLSFHWVCFFRSIQLSTVAVGLLSYSSFPLFTSLLEPLIMKERLEKDKIVLALICLGGIFLIIPRLVFSNTVFQGVLWGLGAGLTFAVLSILNRRLVQKYSSMLIAFYLNATAALFLLPFLFFIPYAFDTRSILLLVALGVFCTALAHTLFIQGMKIISARTASIISTLEPVYGIIIAAILLKEIPSIRTLAGGLIILGTASAVTLKSSEKTSSLLTKTPAKEKNE